MVLGSLATHGFCGLVRAVAVEASGAGLRVFVPARSCEPSGEQDRVVVLHRESSKPPTVGGSGIRSRSSASASTAAPANPSKWAVRDLFMTHLAVSDAKGQRYRFAEKLTRGGPGAGGRRQRSLSRLERGLDGGALDGARHKLVGARAREAGIDLVLDEGKPTVIHGVTASARRARSRATRRTTTR